MPLHPLLARASVGELPDWARAGPERRAHMDRVAELMGRWARSRGLEDRDRRRWTASGLLHDVLRDEDPDELRKRVPHELQDLPGSLLHGPAAVARLRTEGVEDEGLLRAIAYHTLGHPLLGTLGRCLYAADFLEPGRDFRNEWRAGLRTRMPRDVTAVLRTVAAARLGRQLDESMPLRRESVAFWNDLVERGP